MGIALRENFMDERIDHSSPKGPQNTLCAEIHRHFGPFFITDITDITDIASTQNHGKVRSPSHCLILFYVE